ncbi:MAG: sugar isomerase domain-containing protein [Candidatus Marinimicrobia bacterium]|nr:sugar isomerase domain-containing protein [Candidatus Neomarinimicrobiota bacterium]
MLAKKWLENAFGVMSKIEQTQMENIQKAAEVMADTIEADRWVHTFGCGHATLPIEEMYPRIGGFVGFHPMVELPLTFFTRITGEMGVHQFVFLERVEGYGDEIMKGYDFDAKDCMWLFSHSGVNAVNIDIALKAKEKGMKLIVFGSYAEGKNRETKHSCGQNLFQLADIVVDNCTPIEDASVELKNHKDKIGPLSTMAFVTTVWMTISTVAEILADRGVKLYIHPSHNLGDPQARERLTEALDEYKRRVKVL